ncbi:MAG: PAS domain-containing protein [Prolixibacteraceae bacterium]|nr:PAS domain-containing protein [Prolixibacteraceae bacterium]
MHLEFVRIEEANDLLNQLIERHPNAIFVANHDFKIEYFNKSFIKLTKREKKDILGKEFCEVLGCTYRGKVVDVDNKFCERCRMRELLSGANVSDLDMIREFKIHNQIVTKHLRFTTNQVIMQGKKLRFVEIEDRTQKH